MRTSKGGAVEACAMPRPFSVSRAGRKARTGRRRTRTAVSASTVAKIVTAPGPRTSRVVVTSAKSSSSVNLNPLTAPWTSKGSSIKVLGLLRIQRNGKHKSVWPCSDSVARLQRQQYDVLVPLFVLTFATERPALPCPAKSPDAFSRRVSLVYRPCFIDLGSPHFWRLPLLK